MVVNSPNKFRILSICATISICATVLIASSQLSVAQPTIEVAFPNLSFSRPVDLQHSGDQTNRLFVVEQNSGVVRVFDNDPGATQALDYLDVSDRFDAGGDEEGLLGLAFHPDFETNGYLYVYYSAANPRRSVIERFRVDSLLQQSVDRESGQVVLEVLQPYSNHNGGQVRFGPDEYLYISLGDGGLGGDPLESGQDRRTLLGSILRIDVDVPAGGQPYSIPPDNPYVDDTTGFKKEIFAYGFRNPWRFSFDEDGNLWVGDVGQSAREEIDLVEKGGNYGWNTMEGTACYDPAIGCNASGLELPVHDYGRGLGQAVTGGFRYRGQRVPELAGSYVFADYETGRIWSMPFDNGISGTVAELMDTNLAIAAFGEDEAGELYFCAFTGRIYHFTANTIDTESDPTRQELRVAAYPNPASGSVTFSVASERPGSATLVVADLLGRTVFEKTADVRAGSPYVFPWMIGAAQQPIASGLYIYRLQLGEQQASGTLLIQR